jgi:coproporphyrinogen III oxidase
MESIKEKFVQHIHQLQDKICFALEKADGHALFFEEKWERPGGGGGRTRVISNGQVFEKGGVNISAVEGEVTPVMRQQLNIHGDYFFATGISLVIHPINPFVPTVHANFRYFELYDGNKNITDSWFGGGTDLTPYYLFDEDAIHFHQTLKDVCDHFDKSYFPAFKKHCDEYFVNKHRNNESRGIGGIFFDYLRPGNEYTAEELLHFSISCSESFLPAYLPIVEKRKWTPYDGSHKYWQEIRRGRYVEFNLIHDRGTLFGLKTNGRTESILMSLPPTVRFDYDYHPQPGSEEDKLFQVCLHPKNWL